MLAEAANGRIVVDPLDYGDEEQEREIDMVIEQLGIILGDRNVKNYKGGLLEGTLRFRIIDKDSLNYAVRYLKVMAIKLERLVLSHCELDSQRLNTLLFNSDWKISDKLIALK